ncbi:MAG: hypothetical protein ABR584_01225 [Candidatus Baltobacteraceae bacterium]
MKRFLGTALALVLCFTGEMAAASARTYGFLTHAAFFSLESKQPNLIDPQVFTADVASIGAIGPQGIVHVAGYRPAYGVDDPATQITNAQGKSLGLTLGQWFLARGTAELSQEETHTRAKLSFSNLVPGGRYSLFENHFAAANVTFTPLDGAGKTNSFTADAKGTATLTVILPVVLSHAEAILLVFHSDGMDHGTERGALGITAHHQLIMRVP